MAKEERFSARVYKSGRAFSIKKETRRKLGIHGGDSVHLVVETPEGRELFRGRKTLMSGPEIYGRDISNALEPGSEIHVIASDPRSLEDSVESESFDIQERAAGFQSNIDIRNAIERYAMALARKELGKKGFTDFHDTSREQCYDYTCRKDGHLFYVEVKGTQGSGKSVILTRNEVKHAQQSPSKSIAVIVHGIKIDLTSFQTSGGVPSVHYPWILEADALEPIQYMWTIKK